MILSSPYIGDEPKLRKFINIFTFLTDNTLVTQKNQKGDVHMKKYLLAVGILTSGLLGLNTAEASEIEKDTMKQIH
ncbi:hypothetical protein AN161_02035 [Lysinibacillus sp. FJAT-14222]|nr:hypothetical protein AN161_02035 [Lysinibacillus sp. FJAT-14222]